MSTKRKKKNGMVWMLIVLIFLVGIMWYHTENLKKKENAYASRAAELENQISGEEQRAEELEELGKFRQTLKYIEQIAREKLGLVFPGEIIVEPEG